MTERLKILLSGPGLMGSKHAELLVKSERSELAGVVAPPSEDNISFAEEQQVPFFESIESALNNLRVDGAIISSPNEFHCDQAIACVDRAIPALVEKPLAADLGGALRIVEIARSSRVPILVGHHRTYSALLQAAQRVIASPDFGQLVVVQGSALFRKPEHYFEEGVWRTKVGGGPLLINLIHDVGILQKLCGPITHVSAQSSNRTRGFEVEDTAAMGFQFESGALGTFILSDAAASQKSWEMTSGENRAYPLFSQANCYHFAGTRGSLDFPTLKTRSYGRDTEPSWWNELSETAIEIDRNNPLERQLAHFEDVIEGATPPLVSAAEGYANMRVVEAVRQASSSHRTVEVAAIEVSSRGGQ